MSHRLMVSAVGVVAAIAFAGACTHPHDGHHGHPTTSTTAPVTIPIDGWAIQGVTQRQVCGGAYMPGRPPCQDPTPFSADVNVTQDGTAIAHITSSADGTFRIPVGPGTYTVQASSPSLVCAAQTVVISGPPVPHMVTLACQLLAP
jgi:hypothetical protein